jgi:uncharacterized protein
MQLALFLFAIIGHVFLWIGILNRTHSIGIPRWITTIATFVCFSLVGFGTFGAGWWWFAGGSDSLSFVNWQPILQPGRLIVFLYSVICWLVAAATLIRWMCFRFRRPPEFLLVHRQRQLDISPVAAALSAEEHRHRIDVHLPGNDTLKLELTERTVEISRLPKALDGLTVVHISDLHFTGLVGKAYFREVVRVCNELNPDLVAITGDLIDKQKCIGWIPDTIGQLKSRYGVYVILGNHDLRVNVTDLRRALSDCGLIDVGGRWMRIEVRGESIIIAGNELPWFSPAADMGNCETRTSQTGQLRMLLSHSPDQLDWARSNDFDLMLCGHTHGGQIRLPIIGPILSPSMSGVKYDCGFFHSHPTLMHVTRGISGKQPLRWNCSPEIAFLTLRAPLEKNR